MQMRFPLVLLLLGMALTLASPTGASTAHQSQSPRTSGKPEPQAARNLTPPCNGHYRKRTNSKRHTHRHKSGAKK